MSVNGGRGRVEVICLTYGEPAEHGWLAQYRYSYSILNRLTRRVAPIPWLATPLIAAKRAQLRKKNFIAQDYHSPLEPISRKQVELLQRLLDAARPGCAFNVRLVLEFRPPYIWTLLDALRAAPPDELVILPLYLAGSDFTDGVSRTDLYRYHRRRNGANPLPRPKYVSCLGSEPRTAAAMADFILRRCDEAGWSARQCREAILILGAHGTVLDVPEGVRNGADETVQLFRNIRKILLPRFARVRNGWLNHVLGGRWTQPEVGRVAERAQRAGIRRVVYFPYGFIGDNTETELEGRAALAGFQWDELLYLTCPNDDEAFMQLLATRVLERLELPGEDWDALELNPNLKAAV